MQINDRPMIQTDSLARSLSTLKTMQNYRLQRFTVEQDLK